MYDQIASLFRCARIVIAEVGDNGTFVFQILIDLSPGMQWKSVYTHLQKSVNTNFNVVPLNSFSRGIKYILSADQTPLFWNYRKDKAIRMLDLQKLKKTYSHLDTPTTTLVTKGSGKKHMDVRPLFGDIENQLDTIDNINNKVLQYQPELEFLMINNPTYDEEEDDKSV